MSSACTLICPSKRFSEAINAISVVFQDNYDVQGETQSWRRIEVRLPQSLIAFTSLIREKPGDQFSKIILSMHNFFRQIKTTAKANKQFVLSRVVNAEMLIGVIAEPAFIEKDKHFDCIWTLADRLDAIVFSGEAMLDAQGVRLLSQTGEADFILASDERHS